MTFNINDHIKTREGHRVQWPLDPDTRARLERLAELEIAITDSTRRRIMSEEKRRRVMLALGFTFFFAGMYGLVLLWLSEIK